jgi:hypothetical protein
MSAAPTLPETWSALLRWLGALVLVAAATDFAAGSAMLALVPRVGEGETMGVVNASVAAEADVLVLGASRAAHHYDDELLTERLGVKVRNGGVDGRGIRYARGMLALCAARHAPRLVVLDLVDIPDEAANARLLLPFAGDPRVADILAGDDWRERVKLTSRLYRMNGAVFALLKNLDTEPPRFGYEPIADGSVDPEWKPLPDVAELPDSVEPELRAFVAEARAYGAHVVFAESPSFRHRHPRAYRELWERVAEEEGIPFWRELGDTPEFPAAAFSDVGHLDEGGARTYTEALVPLFEAELAKL